MDGAKLRKLRMKKGLSQTEFARKVGVNPATICQMETGVHGVSPRIEAAAQKYLKAKPNHKPKQARKIQSSINVELPNTFTARVSLTPDWSTLEIENG